MSKIVRLVVPALSIVALAACSRDRLDRDRTSTVTPSDRPNVAVDQDRDRNGSVNLNRDPSGSTTLTGANVGGTTSNESAIARIVNARCAREAACANVGVDKRYASHDVCSQKIRTDMRDDLNAKDCPKGIDAKELNECLESIQKESCGNPIEQINRIAACRTSDLCLKADTTNR